MTKIYANLPFKTLRKMAKKIGLRLVRRPFEPGFALEKGRWTIAYFGSGSTGRKAVNKYLDEREDKMKREKVIAQMEEILGQMNELIDELSKSDTRRYREHGYSVQQDGVNLATRFAGIAGQLGEGDVREKYQRIVTE